MSKLSDIKDSAALVAGVARATGHHPAPGSAPAWLGIGLGLSGLATVGYAISRGGR